jgi:ABC-type Fe3+/spermidine/putrescine transport system ATPase subunit
MRAGRLEQVGTPEEIYDAPATAFVARFIGTANMIPVVVGASAAGNAEVTLPGERRGEAPTAGRDFAAGVQALLMVRPEDLELGAGEPPPERIGLPVTCTDIVFQGPVVRCALLDAAGDELVVYLEEHEQQPEVRPGAALWLSWKPRAGRLLHPDST